VVNTLEAGKRRGWIALGAGAFIVLLMGSIWIWVDRLLAGNPSALADTSTAQTLGKLNVAFAMIVIAGVLGTVNGWLMTRTGERNKVLVWALVVIAIGGLFTAYHAV
jgi:hypothetical protein